MEAISLIFLISLLGNSDLIFPNNNNDPVTIKYQENEIEVTPLVSGAFKLFLHHETKLVKGPQYRKSKTVLVRRYYLKFNDQVEKITPYNYKKIIATHLSNAPDLHQKLGKPGFRYENIPSMVNYYNQFKISELGKRL